MRVINIYGDEKDGKGRGAIDDPRWNVDSYNPAEHGRQVEDTIKIK